MRKMGFTLSLCTVLTFSFLVRAQDYSVTLLPTLGGKLTRAFAINESGQVTGVSDTSTFPHAFVWSRTGGIQDLGTLGGADSTGFAINASGLVAGYSYLCACQPIAFLWSPASGMRDLRAPSQHSGIAFGINKYSEIVGTYQDTSSKGFLWTQGQGARDLGILGCPGCLPNAINDRHQVVGSVLLPDGTSHAFIWTRAGGMTDLGTLGGPNSAARAINGTGRVVGVSDVPGGVQHAFFWSRATGMQDLGTLPGESYSSAAAIDAAGRVVGSSWNTGKVPGLPFSWTQAGGMKQLGPFTQNNISSADGVNSAGQILVSAYRTVGYSSYLMTPLMHTSLTSSANPSHVGEPVTFTATVNSAVQGPPPDGEIVRLMSGASVLATSTLEAGVATFTLALKGTRTVRAVYAGDSNYAPSKSDSLIQVVE